jgi:hypothetical protein
MADERTLERSDREIFPAINPADGSLFDAYITMRRAAWVAKRGKGAVWEMAHTVTAVMCRPFSVHEGIRWEEDEDRDKNSDVDSWLCYCGHPSTYYDPNSVSPQPAGSDDVFLVFLNKERVAYHWRWDDADDDGSKLPFGHATRFQRRVL